MSQLKGFLSQLNPKKLNNKTIALLFLLAVLALPTIVLASTPIFIMEGETKLVEVSSRDLNCIKTSTQGISVGTNSKSIDVTVKQGNVFVSFKEGENTPQEVLLMTPNGEVFTLILVPKNIPSQTIILRLPTKYHDNNSDSDELQKDYVDRLKEIIKSMYHDIAPEGFSIKEEHKNTPKWAGISMTMIYSYDSASIRGESYRLQNQTKNTIRILPNDFYEKGVLAVSVDSNDLAPKETTTVYILKRKDEGGKTKAKISSPLEIMSFTK